MDHRRVCATLLLQHSPPGGLPLVASDSTSSWGRIAPVRGAHTVMASAATGGIVAGGTQGQQDLTSQLHPSNVREDERVSDCNAAGTIG
ncbi:hypothetical protein PI124_g16995 [Phytophthora idaei]|nr:hypothetical protein PI125_g22425 [Phytophthora idaei]KAG3133416.1 hypothetical protein PI126_g19193 [Phytophthora idaei]KAG3238036.1 hypothetical protein PI124_g16995 [Phytophthora idaei]